MRSIDPSALETMTSPVRHVMKTIHQALVNIAPEKQEAFDREFDEFTLEYLDSGQWVCRVDTSTKHIQLSRKPVEVMWASAFMCFRLYQIGQESPGGTQLNLTSHSYLGPAAQLLQWAFDSWLDDQGAPWPTELPAPVSQPIYKSDLFVADELCLCATALLLHHELSHIKLCHSGPTTPDIERDADYHAVDWILNDVTEDDEYFLKRVFSVVIPYTAISAYEMYKGVGWKGTHPHGFNRLIHSLDRHINDPNHLAWFATGLLLALHLQNHGGNVFHPDEGFESARACVEAHVEALSRIV